MLCFKNRLCKVQYKQYRNFNDFPHPTLAVAAKGLFHRLSPNGNSISSVTIDKYFREEGIFLKEDPRLTSLQVFHDDTSREWTIDEFVDQLMKGPTVLVEKMLHGELIVGDVKRFKGVVSSIFEETKSIVGGKVADYIPQLAEVDPDQFSVSFCSIDGQKFSFGDHKVPFCLQSCSKPITYAIAIEAWGPELVHSHVGKEPSGKSFNAMELNRNNIPHNPMLNAGAIMACSLVLPDKYLFERYEYIINIWKKLAVTSQIQFNNSVYLSEKDTAHRNFCLGHMMMEKKAFPKGTDLRKTLELYFMNCSLEMDSDSLAMAGAALANGGVAPTSSERIFSPETVKNCLSLMHSCGLYDASGDWAFTVGLPAKSGVSGCIMTVIQGFGCFAVWSPRLDEVGNSFRGVKFVEKLVEKFAFHVFEQDGRGLKIDPTRRFFAINSRSLLFEALYASSEGDLSELQKIFASPEITPDAVDYDGRTCLHLACTHGHYDAVKFLLQIGANPHIEDRWHNTAKDCAKQYGHLNLVDLMSTFSV